MGLVGEPEQYIVDLAVGLCLGLIGRRCQALVCMSDSYPERSILGLHSDAGRSEELVREMMSDWDLLLRSERNALRHIGLSRVLLAIFWAKFSAFRLVFHVIEVMQGQPRRDILNKLLRSIHLRLPDTKVVEDMHSHLRDATRTQRAVTASRGRRMAACCESGALEARGLPSVNVSSDEIGRAPAKLLTEKLAPRFFCKPRSWSPTTRI